MAYVCAKLGGPPCPHPIDHLIVTDLVVIPYHIVFPCLYLMWSVLSLRASSGRLRDCLSISLSYLWAQGGILTPTPSDKLSLHPWTPNRMQGVGAT